MGFAVVAAEVRKLAERSQLAAGEINRLSMSSVQVTEQCRPAYNTNSTSHSEDSRSCSGNNAASNEQKTGAEQINKALQQLDQVIQQNAAGAEEMASTSHELKGQSDNLQNVLGFFKIDGSGNRTAKNRFDQKTES